MKEKENTKPINTHADTVKDSCKKTSAIPTTRTHPVEADPENTIDKMFVEAVKALGLKSPYTDGPISPEELIDTLKEDVVLVLKRPGSWESAKMMAVLIAHGFF